MADDVTLPGTGSKVAADEGPNGVLYQRMKVVDSAFNDIDLASSDDISNKDIMLAIKALLQIIANPPTVDKTSNQQRVNAVIASGTVTTVSTVTSCTALVNIDGYQGKLLPISQSMAAWQLSVRNRIS